MEKNLSDIYQVLQKLIGLHRQLMETVRLEHEALVAADLKGIQETTCAKEALIQAIRSRELERMRATSELSLSWKRPLRELTLPNLIIAVQGGDPAAAEQLRSSYNALSVMVSRIAEQNEANRRLVERSLEHVGNMKKNVLGEAQAAAATYTPQGQKTTGPGGSRLISKEA